MTDSDRPSVIVLAGPNGAGKSTVAEKLLAEALRVFHFVNADTIARGLSAFRFDEMAVKAGRVMLAHLKDLVKANANFAFESTLASRTFATLITQWKRQGYRFYLFFLWVASPEICIGRVQERVRQGGHGISPETIRRRYHRGLANFFRHYVSMADSWHFYDNSTHNEPRLLAQGADTMETAHDHALWTQIKAQVAR